MIAHFDKKGKKKKKDMKKNINELKPHPRNTEFFDDIEGKKWDEFLESIKTNGVIEPIIITQDDVIVSGHQRVKACKELGIEKVACIVKQYDNDDDVLMDLIETNVKQRGIVGGSPDKITKCYEELKRLYGIKQGTHLSCVSGNTSVDELAKEFGLTVQQIRKYKIISDSIPELSEAVEAGAFSVTSATSIARRLSENEQLKLISELDASKKYSQQETANLIEEIEILRNRPPEVVEKVPEHLKGMEAKLAKADETIAGMKKDYKQVRDDLEERTTERNELKNRLAEMEAADAGEQVKKHRIDTGILFNARVTKFIEDVAGYVWLTDEIMELPDVDRELFIRTVEKVRQWAEQMEYNINQKMEAN